MADDQAPRVTDAQASAPAPVADNAKPTSDATAAAVRVDDRDREDRRSGGGRGGRGGRGGGNNNKRKDKWGNKRKNPPSQRERTQDEWVQRNKKKRRLDDNGNIIAGVDADGTPQMSRMSIPFSAEEIAAEERRPKRKVAVLVGYAGTGYKGMQINHLDKTIEGELFSAFVKAGAIAKVNANDPKKSSLVRCARTDKGVHAAGNVISLKLIVEDDDVVKKINDELPDQIRVWGIERTNNGFSCYQACDSRWYEYLLPSYSLLPPHPDSYLGKQVVKSAQEKGVYDEVRERLDDVRDFWAEVEQTDIVPILEKLDPEVRREVLEKLHSSAEWKEQGWKRLDDIENPRNKPSKAAIEGEIDSVLSAPPFEAAEVSTSPVEAAAPPTAEDSTAVPETAEDSTGAPSEATPDKEINAEESSTGAEKERTKFLRSMSPAEAALREIKATLVAAKRRYRITPARLARLQAALSEYVGTHNFHNYTVDKTFADPSANRHIKSFVANTTPIQIRDTEWLSLKVHGQSFMMHQIRKMVAMAVMVARCGAPLGRIKESYSEKRISIPKAPGLGLLLERPVFDLYNQRAVNNMGKEAIDFGKYDKEIEEFKHRQIYSRMWDVEESENIFHTFFNQLDNYNATYFLWVTAGGLDAAFERVDKGTGKGVDELAEVIKDDGGGEVDESQN